ncbi:hypothetical protein Tco_1251603 [Tanacetum coccineum]
MIQAQLEVNTASYWLMLLGLRSTAGMVVLELILLGLVNTAKLGLVNTANVGKELTVVAPSESKAANKVKETALPEPKQPAFFTEVSCPELKTPPSALLMLASVTALPEPNLQTL